MEENKLKEILLFGKYSNINPFKPLMLWGNTNLELNDFYKLPTVNLTDNKQDRHIKNTMRHITGPAVMTQEYNPAFTRTMAMVKELADLISDRDIRDNVIDFSNNDLGINYTINNPNATRKQIMEYAYQKALENYEKQYGEKYKKEFKPIKTIYGEIIDIPQDNMFNNIN